MRTRFWLTMGLVVSILSLSSFLIRASATSGEPLATNAQVQIGRGLVRTPSLGQVLEASLPVTLNWALDIPADVESQDLLLSTDGGLNFETMIAGNLPRQQQQLIWAPGYFNATARGKLKVSLNLVNGERAEVVSDDFSILPAPRSPKLAALARKKVMEGSSSGGVAPAFASPGPCVSGTLPTLNYNMGITNSTCAAFYGREPSLAQDPTNPGHFHTVSAFNGDTNITGGNWQFTGTAVTSQLIFMDSSQPYLARGDMTTAIGLDGTVYVVSMGGTTFNTNIPPNSIMIFRSKKPAIGDSGATFEPVVRIPGLPISAIDKPVVAVHPGNANILVITFTEISGGGVATWLAICNAASTDGSGNPSDLSNPSYWSYVKPRKSSSPDDYLDVVNSTHPVIDPISSGSTAYWLFMVQPNAFLTNGTGGAKVYKYQLNNGDPATLLGAPVQTPPVPPGGAAGETSVGYPLWTTNSNGCTAIEETVRASSQCSTNAGNIARAAIDYCDTNAHRKYIPVLANTLNSGLNKPRTSDLFVIIWQYSGTPDPSCPTGICTSRILPVENHKYNPCAATDGHGRVWINCYAVTSAQNSVYGTVDYQTAQMGAFAVDRITGAPGSIAYMSLRLPQTFNPATDINKFGDYVYTEATYYPSSGGSRIAMPTYTDLLCRGSDGILRPDFWISVSGWQ